VNTKLLLLALATTVLATNVFTNGTFTNGTFTNGTFTNGTFTNGTFANGTYQAVDLQTSAGSTLSITQGTSTGYSSAVSAFWRPVILQSGLTVSVLSTSLRQLKLTPNSPPNCHYSLSSGHPSAASQTSL
jgi:hypothetical protein